MTKIRPTMYELVRPTAKTVKKVSVVGGYICYLENDFLRVCDASGSYVKTQVISCNDFTTDGEKIISVVCNNEIKNYELPELVEIFTVVLDEHISCITYDTERMGIVGVSGSRIFLVETRETEVRYVCNTLTMVRQIYTGTNGFILCVSESGLVLLNDSFEQIHSLAIDNIRFTTLQLGIIVVQSSTNLFFIDVKTL